MTFSASSFRAPAWKPLALASAISALFATSSHAQTEEIKSLAPVVVTASRIEQSQAEAIPHTTVITQEIIRQRQATDVVSLLRSEAGVEITQTGGAGSPTSLFMRGGESRHNLILIDGIPIRDATALGTAAALQHILPDQIERIEIVRGNVSAIYGSGAIGGVIQIFTKQGTGAPRINFSAEAGSRGTTKVNGGVFGKSGNTRYSLSATRYETDGYSSMNTTQYPSENPDNDGNRNIGVAGMVSHEWHRGQEFGVRLYANDAQTELDGGGYGTATQIDKGTSKHYTATAFSKNRLTDQWLSTIVASESETRRKDMAANGGVQLSLARYKGTTDMLQWINEVSLSPNWIITAGFDSAHEKADTYSDYGGGASQSLYSRSNQSAHAGVNGKIDAHNVQANVRYDDVGGSGSDATWYLGYGYDLTTAWKLIASRSTAFLAPSLYQLYDPDNGNANLKSERSRSNEAGVQYFDKHVLVRAVYFETKTSDLINWRSTGGWTGQYFNTTSASNHGVELSAMGNIYGTDLRASLTRQNPKDDDTGEQLVRRAKTLAAFAMSKQLGLWRIGGDVQYTGHSPDNDYTTTPATPVNLSSYILLNLNARYQINKAVSVYGRIENVFDKEYQTAYGYNQAERGFFAGIEWRQ